MRTSVLGGEVTARGLFGKLDRRSGAVLCVLGVLAVFAWLVVGGMTGLIVGFALVLAGFLALHPWNGRRSLAGHWMWEWRFLLRRLTGDTVFVPADRTVATAPTRHGRRVRAAGLVPPALGRVAPLDLRGTPHEDMFILRHGNPGEPEYLSVVMQVDGQAQGLRSVRDYETSSTRYGVMLSQLAREGSFIRGMQQINRIVPHDPARHRAFVAARVAGRSGIAELVSSYEDLIDLTAHTAEQHRNYLVPKFPLTAEFFAAAHHYGKDVAGWAGLVREELARLADLAARADLAGPRVLGEQRTCALLRSLQNPDHPIDQHEGVRWRNCWQPYRGERNYVVVDDTWFTRTAVLPRDALGAVPLGPRWLAPLLIEVNPAVIRTLSVRMDFVPARIARAAAVRDVTIDGASKLQGDRRGQIADGTDDVMLTASRRRLDDLAPGSGHHGLGWSMMISVTASDLAELSRVCTRISNAAADCAMNRLEWQDTWHDVANLMTFPLARGLAVSR